MGNDDCLSVGGIRARSPGSDDALTRFPSGESESFCFPFSGMVPWCPRELRWMSHRMAWSRRLAAQNPLLPSIVTKIAVLSPPSGMLFSKFFGPPKLNQLSHWLMREFRPMVDHEFNVCQCRRRKSLLAAGQLFHQDFQSGVMAHDHDPFVFL